MVFSKLVFIISVITQSSPCLLKILQTFFPASSASSPGQPWAVFIFCFVLFFKLLNNLFQTSSVFIAVDTVEYIVEWSLVIEFNNNWEDNARSTYEL